MNARAFRSIRSACPPSGRPRNALDVPPRRARTGGEPGEERAGEGGGEGGGGPGAGPLAGLGFAGEGALGAAPSRSEAAAERVRWLVAVSAAPLAPVPDGQGLVDRAMPAVVGSVLEDVHADLRAMEGELAVASADWTAVRPPRLTDKPVTGRYRTVAGGTPSRGRTLARADAAYAMPAMIDDPATVRQGAGVAY
ncbi:NAD(P)H-binding protein [Streptomyces sp. NPDC053755]|uniref:NAD(P)H-binding protein n=1 Tax=Streptomyces sp. NPDC053755 TaxID=3155815 RepID=UPI003422248A